MDIKKLTAFSLVAKNGSLLRAANILKVTVPAVSVQLKRLEQEVGVTLFQRLPNKLILTTHGRVFLEKINSILRELEDAKTLARFTSTSYAGRISISLGGDMAKFFVPPIGAFMKKHPDLSISILTRTSPESMSLVHSGEVDMGVGRFATLPRGFKSLDIFELGVFLVFPQKHPLAQKPHISLWDLVAHRVILLTRNSTTRVQIDRALLRNGIELQDILEVSNCQSALDLVRLRLGVALVHDLCAPSQSSRSLHTIDFSRYFKKAYISLIHRNSMPMTLAHRGLLQTIMETRIISKRTSG